MEATRETVISKYYSGKIFRRVASNFIWTVISETTSKGVFFIANIYLARKLGVSNFGLFALAQTITFYFWLTVDLGTNMYGIREIARNKEKALPIINSLLTLRITAGFIIFVIYTSSIAFFIPTENKLVFIGCGLYLLTYSFYTDWIFKGLEKFRYIAFGSIISSLLFLGGIVFFISSGNDVVIASLIWSFSYVLGGIFLFFFLYIKLGIKLKPELNIKIWLSHLSKSIFFTLSGSMMALYQYMPILILSIIFTSFEVGIFSAPYRVITVICSMGFLLPMSLYPVFSDLYQTDYKAFQKTHKRLILTMITLGLLIAFLGTAFGSELVGILFGNAYIQSALIFKLTIWIVPLSFARYSFGSVLQACCYQKQHLIAPIFSVIALVIAGLPLINVFGTFGIALTLIICELTMIICLIAIFYLKIYFKHKSKYHESI